MFPGLLVLHLSMCLRVARVLPVYKAISPSPNIRDGAPWIWCPPSLKKYKHKVAASAQTSCERSRCEAADSCVDSKWFFFCRGGRDPRQNLSCSVHVRRQRDNDMKNSPIRPQNPSLSCRIPFGLINVSVPSCGVAPAQHKQPRLFNSSRNWVCVFHRAAVAIN